MTTPAGLAVTVEWEPVEGLPCGAPAYVDVANIPNQYVACVRPLGHAGDHHWNLQWRNEAGVAYVLDLGWAAP